MDANQSLALLKEGNARFCANAAKAFDRNKRREELLAGQHPFATILSCSDSRVVPEYVFDTMPGEIFIIRTAGNVAGEVDLGSIEYGTEHLHTPILLVLGHTKCGAVKATCDCRGKGGEGHIASIVKEVDKAAKQKNYENDSSIRCNVECSIQNIRERSKIVNHLEHEGKLKIMGALYHLETGKVEFL
ncbi:Carbonic anhydrase [uncultured archaeon]|nr:Carbonic anhydrase [uncultured archaeon]